MSVMCSLAVCKAQVGMCGHEKAMLSIALLAPNAHPWEIQYCAALAATLKGEDTGIIVRSVPAVSSTLVSEHPGTGIDWALEASFQSIQWQR